MYSSIAGFTKCIERRNNNIPSLTTLEQFQRLLETYIIGQDIKAQSGKFPLYSGGSDLVRFFCKYRLNIKNKTPHVSHVGRVRKDKKIPFEIEIL